MMRQSTQEVTIERFYQGKTEKVSDVVIVEQPLHIFLNGTKIVTLLCTPNHLKSLAIGFLASEGILNGRDEINSIRMRGNSCIVQTKEKKDLIEWSYRSRVITSGCGKGVIFNDLELIGFKPIDSELTLSKEKLLIMVKNFQQKSELYKTTGGTHSAALSDGGGITSENILIFHEDIGRHNAVDKVIGDAFLQQIPLDDKILITSGRVSSEILFKVAKRGIPLLVAISAPTDMAIELADKLGVTLIGFARGKRMNAYAHEERIRD